MTPRPEGRQPLPDHAKKVFSGILFDVYQWEQELFDGSTATFEKLKRPDSAFVVPVLENGNLLIAEDVQPGRDTVLTFPGGQIDAGEDPEAGVLRELLEETGHAATSIEFWKANNAFSKVDWAVYVFIARGVHWVQDVVQDPGEHITIKEITFDDLFTLPDDPRFQSVEILRELIEGRYDEEKRAALYNKIYG